MSSRRGQKMWYFLLSLAVVVVCLILYVAGLAEQHLNVARSKLETPESMLRFEQLKEVANIQQDEVEPSETESTFTPEEIKAARDSMEAYAAIASEYTARLDTSDSWHAITHDFPDSMSEWTDAEWEQVAVLIAENADFIAKIRALAAQGGPYYPLDFSQGFSMQLPHLAPLRDYARLLRVDAGLQARSGNWEQTVEDLLAETQLAGGLKKEPILISQLVGVSINGMTIETIMECVPPGVLSPAMGTQLVESMLSHVDHEQLAATMAAEATCSTLFFDAVRNGDTVYTSGDIPPIASWIYSTTIGQTFISFDETRYIEMIAPLPDIARLPYYQAIDSLEAFDAEIEDLPWTKPLTRMLIPSVTHALAAPAEDEARIGLLNLGLSLEAYYESYGSYPASLDSISPLVGTIPVDPFTGEAFHYIPNGDTFTLYSVGRDLEDDGGHHDTRKGDIVWRGRREDKLRSR